MTLRTFKIHAARRELRGLILGAAVCLAPWQSACAQITVAGPMNFDLTTSHLQAVQMQSSLISTSRIMQQQSEYHRSTLRPSQPSVSAAPRNAGYGAPVASAASLAIGRDPKVSGELRNEVFSNIEHAAGADTARKVDQTLGDIQATFSRAVSPYGLHNDDFADVMAAYLVVMWMAANERTTLPNVAQVQAVRSQMQRLYSNGAQPPVEPRQRQLVAETLMYETCLAIGTRENGSAQAIRNMADSTQRKLSRNGFDMRALALTDAGLVQRAR
jgi:hypothetical protein